MNKTNKNIAFLNPGLLNLFRLWLLLLMLFISTLPAHSAKPYSHMDSLILESYWIKLKSIITYYPDSSLALTELIAKKYLEHSDTVNYLEMQHIMRAQILMLKSFTSEALIEVEAYIHELEKRNILINSNAYLELGNAYYKMKLYNNAIVNYHKAINYPEPDKDKWITPVALNNIGESYTNLNQNRKARGYYLASFAYSRKYVPDTLRMLYTLLLISESHYREGETEKSNRLLKLAAKVFDRTYKQTADLSFGSNCIRTDIIMEQIHVARLEGKTGEMKDLFSKVEALLSKPKYSFLLASYYLKMANEWLYSNKAGDASKMLSKFYNLGFRLIGNQRKMEYAKLRYKTDSALHNTKEATSWKIAYLQYKDSLIKETDASKIIELTTSAMQSRNDLIHVQRQQQIESSNRLINQGLKIRWISFIGFALLLAGVVVSLRFYLRSRHDNNVIMKQNRENEILIREIHHRVKNNLTVISGILDMQMRNIQDPNLLQGFKDARFRIVTMALVHKYLYEQEDFMGIDSQVYFENLIKTIAQSYHSGDCKITYKINCNNIQFNIDSLIPLALITNELLTNSFKYAFREKENGAITILIEDSDNSCIFTYTDNGSGSENVATEGLGTKLIDGLTRQLKGAVQKWYSNTGVKYVISFPSSNSF